MDFQTALHELVRNRYIEICGEREFGGSASARQGKYYLMHLEDNLVQPMAQRHRKQYGCGNGNELEGKMKALRSSSAMTFNLLGNEAVVFSSAAPFGKGAYALDYEYQLPTIKGNPNPANLDAKLTAMDASAAVFCEMKMMEWLTSKPGGLREAYLDASNYLVPRDEAEAFVKLFQSFASDAVQDGRVNCRLHTYDAFQMCKHLLAVYSGMRTGAESKPADVWLVNCVWGLQNVNALGKHAERYQKLHEAELAGFSEFESAAKRIEPLFAAIGVKLHVAFTSFADMLGWMETDETRKAALERYIV